MTEHYRCGHGLTLAENCEACEIEMAMEQERRFGPLVDEARKTIAGATLPDSEDGEV